MAPLTENPARLSVIVGSLFTTLADTTFWLSLVCVPVVGLLFYFHFDKTSIIHGQLVIDLITSGVLSMANKPTAKSPSSAPMEAKTLL